MRESTELWTRDGTKLDSLLYAGNSLGRARTIFERSIDHRPRIRLTIRQRTGCSINGRRLTRDGAQDRQTTGAVATERPPVKRDRYVLFHFVRDDPRLPRYDPRLHRSPYIDRLTHLYVILVF
jgi:hypothetical protein